MVQMITLVVIVFSLLVPSLGHPCLRKCSTDPAQVKICYFNFTLSNDLVLSPLHCGACPSIQKDCGNPSCIPVNGSPRRVAIVNKMLPGPSIRVCEGDRIVVDVTNNLVGQETAIHWHGIHQKKTQWMDGVPQVTQCPIPPSTTFRYEFETPIAGTYFWHSHEASQRADGIAGVMVVRKPLEKDVHGQLYDYDSPEHELLIQDWFSVQPLNHRFNGNPVKLMNDTVLASTILVNGKGFPPNFFPNGESTDTIKNKGMVFVPPAEFRIKSKKLYRFRVISNGIGNCPVEMSIENHTLTIIAADGFDLKPINVTSLGERWDFILSANQPPGSYWIKFRGLLDCKLTKAFQLAVLNYDEVTPGQLPNNSITRWEQAEPPPGLQLNTPNTGPLKNTSILTSELESIFDDDPQLQLDKFVDHQFYLSFDFDMFHTIKSGNGAFLNILPQLNFITLQMPSEPPLIYPEKIVDINKCDASTTKRCSQIICWCTHWLQVKLNSTVELILVNRGHNSNTSHPFHLHGHSFVVMAMEKSIMATQAGIQDLDKKGLIHRTKYKAPMKDTVPVPNGGYTIIRFRANNQGFWLFHCHIELHTILGMGLIFQVGDLNEILPPPANFRECSKSFKSILPLPLPLSVPKIKF